MAPIDAGFNIKRRIGSAAARARSKAPPAWRVPVAAKKKWPAGWAPTGQVSGLDGRKAEENPARASAAGAGAIRA